MKCRVDCLQICAAHSRDILSRIMLVAQVAPKVESSCPLIDSDSRCGRRIDQNRAERNRREHFYSLPLARTNAHCVAWPRVTSTSRSRTLTRAVESATVLPQLPAGRFRFHTRAFHPDYSRLYCSQVYCTHGDWRHLRNALIHSSFGTEFRIQHVNVLKCNRYSYRDVRKFSKRSAAIDAM